MITYKYRLYTTKKTHSIDTMLRECAYVWNHALALQRRYYKMFKKFIPYVRMAKHFTKTYERNLIHSQTLQEILERQDNAFQRFFKHLSKRPPKFRKSKDFTTLVFKGKGGYSLSGNIFKINRLNKTYKFSLSRPYEGNVKTLSVKRTPMGEYYIVIVTDANAKHYRKTHDGASVGVDFGLKTYMTLSTGERLTQPQYLKANLTELRKLSRNHSKKQKGSNNRKISRLALCKLHNKIVNQRRDYQWKLAHAMCREYDNIFLEDLVLTGMCRKWGRKMGDYAHGEFLQILQQVADKYGCNVVKVGKWFASSRLCTCGYKNDNLSLKDRSWVCPQCGAEHDRDVHAANNILGEGIHLLESRSKSTMASAIGCLR